MPSDRITLVAMGKEGSWRSSEDEICALHLRNLLEGRNGNPEAARQMILAGGEVAKFGDAKRPWFNPDDVPFALDIDRYNFAIRVKDEGGQLIARLGPGIKLSIYLARRERVFASGEIV